MRSRYICLAIVLIPISVVIYQAYTVLYGDIRATVEAFGYTGASAAVKKHCVNAIKSGAGRQPWFFQPNMDNAIPIVLRSAWLALFGYFFFPEPIRKKEFIRLSVADGDDRFCYELMGYSWTNPLLEGGSFIYPSVYADSADIREWIRACKQVYPDLGPEERKLLDPYRSAGRIPQEVLLPPASDYPGRKERSRAEGVVYEDSRKLSKQEIAEIVNASLRKSIFVDAVPDVPQATLDYYDLINLRTPNVIEPTWEAVGEATRKGRIAKFDARKLMPEKLINITFQELAQMEGPAANRIPVWGDFQLPTSLQAFADDRMGVMTEATRRTHITIAELSQASCCEPEEHFSGDAKRRAAVPPYFYGFKMAGYINTRRIPAFHKLLPEIESLTGIKGDVLRGQSQLWMGGTAGGFHYDEEANIYVQLTGETYAFLVPQNYTDAFTGAIRHPWGSVGLPSREEFERDPYLKQVPVYLVHLGPGDGITLQGRTYHRFMAHTQDRIALNWFFIPGWRKMEYNPADWYSVEAERSLERLATRQLWARTLSRAFDNDGTGVIYMGNKLEYV
mmetsp:Transcript_52178/g.167181  ORF Transcript_52178/g.167181 Transcript_52178/m.167181 type:complete len:562 (-) Transcript_52178:50-1735(-)